VSSYLSRSKPHAQNECTAQYESRDLLGLLGLVDGLLGSVASIVDLSDRRPDAAHPFQAPGPTDQRGPCPGMNILANHGTSSCYRYRYPLLNANIIGYLPRNGIVTVGQAIQASGEGFNMGVDIAAALSVLAVIASGNLITGTFSIGGEDDRTYSTSGLGSKAAGRQWGLDSHSRIEADASATRADFFLNNGSVTRYTSCGKTWLTSLLVCRDSHSGIGSRFARFVKLAAAHGGQFTVEAANELYGQNVRMSLAQNPRFFQSSYTILAPLATVRKTHPAGYHQLNSECSMPLSLTFSRTERMGSGMSCFGTHSAIT
jgi:hypothetical protein